MSERDRRGWLVVGAIFVTMFFIWGAIYSGGVFFIPVLEYFGWTRAKFSLALSISWVTGGAAAPAIGWLADRINPKWIILTGAVIVGLLWLALSRATSFNHFCLINGLAGIFVGASTGIPCLMVIASWFERQRGLAMGIATAGATIGGAVMTPLTNHVIAGAEWRAGYVALGLPILLIVVPLIFFLVDPGSAERKETAPLILSDKPAPAPAARELPGLNVNQAAKTRSFWIICAINLLGGTASAMNPHFVAYLIGVGYSPASAASVVSMSLLMTTAGALIGGPMADRAGARRAMVMTNVLGALGFIGLMTASTLPGMILIIVVGGFAGGAGGVQMPLLIIESLGVKRLGSLLGVTGIFFTLGAAVAPIIAGHIFDVTGSYQPTIISCIGMSVVAAVAVTGCRSLSSEESRFADPAPSAAA
jgi:MFS family permease